MSRVFRKSDVTLGLASLGMLIGAALASPLYANTTILQEDFSGTAGNSVAGWNGWTGDSGLVISSTVIDGGNSLGWPGTGTPAVLKVGKTFSYTPGLWEAYVLTATLSTTAASGYYTGVVLGNTGGPYATPNVGLLISGGTLYFFQNEDTGNGIHIPQSATTVDIKIVLSDAQTACCYYRGHGATDWIYAGGFVTGNALSSYNRITVFGEIGYPGNVDTITLTAASDPSLLLYEPFSGSPGTSVTSANTGWTGSPYIVFSDAVFDSGYSATWTNDTEWPGITKTFSHTPVPGESYALSATLNTPDTAGDYYSIATLSGASSTPNIGAMILNGTLYFYHDDDYLNSNAPHVAQGTATVDVRMVATDAGTVLCYYRNLGASNWTYLGSLTTGDVLSSYDRVNVYGHANHPGHIDSIVVSVTPPMSRGRQILLDRGTIQIQAMAAWNTSPTAAQVARWNESHLTAINFWDDLNIPALVGAMNAGTNWSRMYRAIATEGYPAIPATKTVSTAEMPYVRDLVSIQYADEVADIPTALPDMTTTIRQWTSMYPQTLAHTNFNWAAPDNLADLKSYTEATKPDVVMFDCYPGFVFPGDRRDTWYSRMQMYRLAGMAGYTTRTGGNSGPIPYGQWLDLYGDSKLPSESFVRLQQNASWAFGYTFLSGFVYNHFSMSVLFDKTTEDPTKTLVFDYLAEANRQSLNLGPALVRLKSTDVRFIPSTYRHRDWFLGPLHNHDLSIPTGLSDWSVGAGDTNLITSITPRGTDNNDVNNHCDWLVGYFQPLKSSNSDYPYANGLHFMVVNGAWGTQFDRDGGTGNAASASAQWVRIEFDFTGTSYTSLQRLSRTTGQTAIVNLTSLGNNKYRLDLQLDGGTGDLFRFYPQ